MKIVLTIQQKSSVSRCEKEVCYEYVKSLGGGGGGDNCLQHTMSNSMTNHSESSSNRHDRKLIHCQAATYLVRTILLFVLAMVL